MEYVDSMIYKNLTSCDDAKEVVMNYIVKIDCSTTSYPGFYPVTTGMELKLWVRGLLQ